MKKIFSAILLVASCCFMSFSQTSAEKDALEMASIVRMAKDARNYGADIINFLPHSVDSFEAFGKERFLVDQLLPTPENLSLSEDSLFKNFFEETTIAAHFRITDNFNFRGENFDNPTKSFWYPQTFETKLTVTIEKLPVERKKSQEYLIYISTQPRPARGNTLSTPPLCEGSVFVADDGEIAKTKLNKNLSDIEWKRLLIYMKSMLILYARS